jgi:hypothetical protein
MAATPTRVAATFFGSSSQPALPRNTAGRSAQEHSVVSVNQAVLTRLFLHDKRCLGTLLARQLTCRYEVIRSAQQSGPLLIRSESGDGVETSPPVLVSRGWQRMGTDARSVRFSTHRFQRLCLRRRSVPELHNVAHAAETSPGGQLPRSSMGDDGISASGS